jgi:hypothetical protein
VATATAVAAADATTDSVEIFFLRVVGVRARSSMAKGVVGDEAEMGGESELKCNN